MFITEVYNNEGEELSYAIDYPDDFDKNEKYPIIFYFHGMGMIGKGIENVKEQVPVRREYMTTEMPYIIVAPYCEKFTWFEYLEKLGQFLDHFIEKEYVDSDMVYITGSSMGGYTCWALSVMYPEKISAAVICCGGGMYFHSAANRIKFPVWAFHGKLDTVVLPRESEIMVERINECGGNAKLTLVENRGHNVWHDAYHCKETYQWLLNNRK